MIKHLQVISRIHEKQILNLYFLFLLQLKYYCFLRLQISTSLYLDRVGLLRLRLID